MKRTITIVLAVAFSFNFASAQNGKIVFGPLDGDSAAVMLVEDGMSITIPVWIRTEPGINIVGLHWPLAAKNDHVASRDDGALFDPFPGWDDVGFLVPNEDGENPEYTNQSMLGIKDLIGTPDPVDGINTEGEWWMVAEYYMTISLGNPIDTVVTDALIAGDHPDNGGFVWSAFEIGELPAESFDYSFSSFYFADNSDPVWCETETEFCGDVGATLCIPLCGTDENMGDDLHIVQISGEGEYTEDIGGPGGYTSGNWCGNLEPGIYTLAFEIRDNAGGDVPLEITVNFQAVTMNIDCVEGFPGGLISIPVTLNTCSFMMGGMDIFISYDSTALSITDVKPTGRIDDGNEFWNVNVESPCEDCPDLEAVRIVWISDINNGVHHSPAYPGDDPVFVMTFRIDEDVEWDTELPITFYNDLNTDNTISDSTGFEWFRPELVNGCINVIDPAGYKGDPNMNGVLYEIGDAVLVVRYLIDGSVVWTENGTSDDAIQHSSADLNNNGIVEITDLVRFILIINGSIEPPKSDPASAIAEIDVSSSDDAIEVSISSDLDVGGVLLEISHPGIEFGTPYAGGMDVTFKDADGIMRAVIYSLEGSSIAAGKSTLLTVPVVSNDGGSIEVTEVSSADAYGRMLETVVLLDAPLPMGYAVFQNYPNPFNAQTSISFAIPEAVHVSVEIFDLLGRSVIILMDSDLQAGFHSVIWDARDQSSGIYFYRIVAGDLDKKSKMVLLK
jgi:hypothetical protein